MKKIMMLGGNHFQVSATKRAKELGYYVISVDYLPNNPAHVYADEYHNVSTIDKVAILSLAKKLKVDGILSYASDVSASTAAYVSEKLGLPTNPYDAVYTLTHKDAFRDFMRKERFLTPQGATFTNYDELLSFFKDIRKTIIVKPIDSSGSKGCIKVVAEGDLLVAYEEAMRYSIAKVVIGEEFIEKEGYQIDGDGFVIDGKIELFFVMDQHNDVECNPHAPIGLSYPSIQSEDIQEAAKEFIQMVFTKLGIQFGAFNFEYIVGTDKKIYLLEIGPRNGGNYIPDTILHATGISMIDWSIKAAVGDLSHVEYSNQLLRPCTSYLVHALENGIFNRIECQEEIEKRIVKQTLFVKEGDYVERFRNGASTIGAMVLAFEDVYRMKEKMDNMNDYIRVLVDSN